MIETEIKQLLIDAKNGDSESFGRIYTEYLTPIYRYIFFRIGNKAKADDLTQDVFLKVFNSLDRIEITNSSPLAYFYTIARNLLIDDYRKKNIPTIDEDLAEKLMVDDNNPEKEALLIESKEMLTEALQKIPPNEADAITLKFISEYSNKEISEIMERSEESVRQLQSRGIKSLRKIINKKDFF